MRVRGYPSRTKSFRTRLEAEGSAARTEAAAYGRTLTLGQQITLNMLLDDAQPGLRSPSDAALAYWRRELRAMRCRDITPAVLAKHRDRLVRVGG